MDVDEQLAEYLRLGVIETREQCGEKVYVLGPNAKELAPELYSEWMEDINDDLMELFQRGIVDVEYDENLVPTFYITELGRSMASDI